MPNGEKMKFRGWSNIICPNIELKTILIGTLRGMAKAQLIMPIISPSVTTTPLIMLLAAPMERITPISRVRSITFRLIMPASPSAPINAVIAAIVSRNAIRKSNWPAQEEDNKSFNVEKRMEHTRRFRRVIGRMKIAHYVAGKPWEDYDPEKGKYPNMERIWNLWYKKYVEEGIK